MTKADYTATVATPNPPTGQTAQFIENSNLNTYGYDAVGNRINETKQNKSKTITLTTDNNGQTTRQEQTANGAVETTTATYDALNQLTQLNEPNEVSTFDYDLNGNLSQIKKNSTITNKYEYDVRNQLSSAKDGLNNEIAKFDYDFERKRLSKTSANFRTDYVYAGSQIVSEFQNNVASANYTIGAGEIVKSDFTVEGARYYFSDALGSTTSLADSNSSLIARNEYDAFGLQSGGTGSANTIGYTGQRLDYETGLMALGNGERYYSPQYARFIQQDSFAGVSNIPQSLNRFAYTYNNPFKYHDPSGNAPQDFNKSDSWHTWNNASHSDNLLEKAAGFTGLFFYEVGDMLTFGGVSRQDRTMTEYQRGEITGSEALWRTTANIAVSAPLLVAGLMTGGASVYVQIGIGAVAAGVQRFGTDNYEMSFEGRKSFSSAGQYALDIALGGLFGGIGGLAGKLPGIANPLVKSAMKEGETFLEKAFLGAKELPKAMRKFIQNENLLLRDELESVGSWFGRGKRFMSSEPTPLPVYETKPHSKTGNPTTAKPDANELQAGKMYEAQGYEVSHKVTASDLGIPNTKTPDLRVKGIGDVDVYTPPNPTTDAISNMIQKKGNQSPTVHVQANITSQTMNEVANRVYGKPSMKALGVREIIFESGGNLTRMPRPFYRIPRNIPKFEIEEGK